MKTAAESREIETIVIGIGINVKERYEDFDEEIRDKAGSILSETGADIDRARPVSYTHLDVYKRQALDGYVIGGGLELALACDIRIASKKTQFAFPEPSLGIIPGYGGSQRLGRVIGFGAAKYYCMTEERIDVQRAYELGLVGKICPDEVTVLEEANRIAKGLKERCPEALAAIKAVMREGQNADIDTAVDIEKKAFDKLFSSPARLSLIHS